MKFKKFTALILSLLILASAGIFASCTAEKPAQNEPQTGEIKTDYILLYNGCEIDKKVGVQPLLGKNGSKENFDKYNREYHYYTFNEYLGSQRAVMTEEYEDDYYIMPENGSWGPGNELAVSENVNIMPRKAEILESVPDEIKNQLPAMMKSDRTPEFVDGDTVYKIDLIGNDESEYVAVSFRIVGNTQKSEINLFDGDFNLVGRLAYMDVVGYEGGETCDLFGAVDFFDIDCDGNIEILVNLPAWEGRGSLSVYKYENEKLLGEADKQILFGP